MAEQSVSDKPRVITRGELVDRLILASRALAVKHENELLRVQDMIVKGLYQCAEELLKQMASSALSSSLNGKSLAGMVNYYFKQNEYADNTAQAANAKLREFLSLQQEFGSSIEQFMGSPIPKIVDDYFNSQPATQVRL